MDLSWESNVSAFYYAISEKAMAPHSSQYSCLENPMDEGAWWATVHGVARVGHDLVTKKTLTPWKESYDQPKRHIKKQRHYFVNKGPSSQGYGFSSSHVWMRELDCEEG